MAMVGRLVSLLTHALLTLHIFCPFAYVEIVDNSLTVCLPDLPALSERTLLDHVLDLGRRSNSTAIKSESTRVAVNIIKSLWASDVSSADPTVKEKREAARKALVSIPTANALAQLIGRSRKYPMLVNEGVIALTLVSTGENGGKS